MRTAILIPVLDEADALPVVLREIGTEFRVIVCDNGSIDSSPAIARSLGAEVVFWPVRGYGGAVRRGMQELSKNPPEIVVVLDGDHSSFIDDLPALLAPIQRGEADFVLGERVTLAESGALTPQQRWGNLLACRLIQTRTGFPYKDMGPLRAIRWEALVSLAMEDLTWGWNVEMQMKAVKIGLRIHEVPVRYRARIGTSKISGTLAGVVRAGAKIMWACWKYR